MTQAGNRTLTLTTQIVAAYLNANAVAIEALPVLIQDVRLSLSGLGRNHTGTAPRETRPEVPRSATVVDIRKSVFADHLVCLEDGKSVMMLKRHLRTAHGLTPERYRAKWGLPAHYPMVAPNYAKRRSKLAKESGLGRGGRPRRG